MTKSSVKIALKKLYSVTYDTLLRIIKNCRVYLHKQKKPYFGQIRILKKEPSQNINIMSINDITVVYDKNVIFQVNIKKKS